MSIRAALAKWLDPETAEQARRYWYLRLRLDDAQRWLGYDFPQVDQAIHWAKATEVNHFRALGKAAVEAVPGRPWIHRIHDFREHLRTERDGVGGDPRPPVTSIEIPGTSQ